MKQAIPMLLLLLAPFTLSAQNDSTKSPFTFQGDVRIRAEYDWNSRKTDGSLRDDRTRLRYRLRAGLLYQHNEWLSAGIRIRTGEANKQQDPQLTLGGGLKEFGTVPIGIDKLYLNIQGAGFTLWVGKNSFPYHKNNELFWSDNVCPEGISLKKKFELSSGAVDFFELQGGHFIINAKGQTFDKDSYFQGWQLATSFFKNRLALHPSFYFFRNIPNIPDGSETFHLNYSIVHIGASLQLLSSPALYVEGDVYHNLEDYKANDSIPSAMKEQTNGIVAALRYGKLQQSGDWMVKTSVASIQRYAAVDFLAQNDWARWDYSSSGSPDGRLTNFKGVEVVVGYMVTNAMSLTVKYYVVEQVEALGANKETGNRMRLDADMKL